MSKKPGATQAMHKVIMVGSGGVGKSALTLQFMYDEVKKKAVYFLHRVALVIVDFLRTRNFSSLSRLRLIRKELSYI